jgi:hypothetical protein
VWQGGSEGVLVKACGEDGSCNDVEGCSGKKKIAENSSQRNSRAQSSGQ